MNKLNIFCVTNEDFKYLNQLDLNLVGVGKNKFPKNYITCTKGNNIQKKEKHYSELTFHYWFWKNMLKKFNSKEWIGFCQKRRFWIKKKKKISDIKVLKSNLIKIAPQKWNKFESVICKPINVSNPKRMKLLKRGWRNILNNPKVIYDQKKQTIKLHFDMHHGYGILDKAIDLLNEKDRIEFRKFVSENRKFNPHLMLITKKKILNLWFKDLFKWLFKCEKVFGFKNLKGYDQQRLYAYLGERYLSFWFRKYTRYIEWDWIFFEK